jgi:hypothetical protein
LADFFELPDIQPIKLRDRQQLEAEINEEIKEVGVLLPSNSNCNLEFAQSCYFDFKNNLTVGERQLLLGKFDLVSTRRITFVKPMLIIYNPSCG